MTTEHEMAMAIATEIGKQVPVKQVYDDTTSPAAKQVGATLEDVVKCVRLVGFPIQWLAVQQDRFRSFIEQAKNQVPVDRRILPEPRLLGPVLEGIRYEVEDSVVSELFSNLLSKAMDADRFSIAHPSFAHTIKQLNPDQAAIIKYIHQRKRLVVAELGTATNKFIVEIYPTENYSDLTNRNLHFNLVHLVHLDLLSPPTMVNPISNEHFGGRSHERVEYELSFIGQAFAEACLPDP